MISLVCNESTLRERLEKDIHAGIRTSDIVERSIERIPLYEYLKTQKIYTDGKSIGQIVAPATCKMTANDFKNNNGTSVYWLGGGGAMVNSHGTIIMIDPVLEGFDIPIMPQEIPKIDGMPATYGSARCDTV